VSPASVDLQPLLAALKSQNIHPIAPTSLAPGASLADLLKSTLATVDFVIAILGKATESSNVLFELGLAYGLGKPVFVIAPPGVSSVPSDLRSAFSLRVPLDNREALDFAIEQFVASLSRSRKAAKVPGKQQPSPPLGPLADTFLMRLESIPYGGPPDYLEHLAADLFRACGLNTFSQPRRGNHEVDFAIWSDELQPFVGNPFIVELKAGLLSGNESTHAAHQLSNYLNTTNATWGLLLYKDGPPSAHIGRHVPLNIIVFSLKELISELRNTPFAIIIRRLRNERVHGVSR